jgi:hypothetical protein
MLLASLIESLRHDSCLCAVHHLEGCSQFRLHSVPCLQVWGGVPISSVEYILGCAMQEAKAVDHGKAEQGHDGLPSAALPLLALVSLSQVLNLCQKMSLSVHENRMNEFQVLMCYFQGASFAVLVLP